MEIEHWLSANSHPFLLGMFFVSVGCNLWLKAKLDRTHQELEREIIARKAIEAELVTLLVWKQQGLREALKKSLIGLVSRFDADLEGTRYFLEHNEFTSRTCCFVIKALKVGLNDRILPLLSLTCDLSDSLVLKVRFTTEMKLLDDWLESGRYATDDTGLKRCLGAVACSLERLNEAGVVQAMLDEEERIDF